MKEIPEAHWQRGGQQRLCGGEAKSLGEARAGVGLTLLDHPTRVVRWPQRRSDPFHGQDVPQAGRVQ